MAGSAILSIKILTDAKNAQQGLDETSTRVGKAQQALGKMVVPAAVAGAAVVAFGKVCVDAASRTQQAMGAVDTVFGRSAGQVKAWAGQAAQSVGLSKAEFGELASTLGASLKNMGVPMKDLAGQTNDLVKLGADLSATYGGTTKEAVEALGSALRGETDPIERYGISIKQATIAAKMAKDGTDDLTGSAATAAKTQALLSLVTEQSGKAVGAFAREADTAAGQQQRANAEWENSKSAIGSAFLPLVTAVTKQLAGLAGWVGKNAGLARVLMVVIGGVAAAILAANIALKAYVVVTELVGVVSKATWLSNPVFLVVAAVVALGVALVVAYKKSKTFRAFVDGMWRGMKAVTLAVVRVIKAAWSGLMTGLRATGKAFAAAWRAVTGAVRSAWSSTTSAVRSAWSNAMAAVRSAVSSVRSAVSSVFGAIRSTIGTIVRGIVSLWRAEIGILVDIVKGIAHFLTDPFDAMSDAVSVVIGWVEKLVGWLDKIKIPDLGKIGDLVGKIPGLGRSVTVAGPTPAGRDPRLRGTARAGSSSTTSGPTFVIQGALDPEGVARQINRILRGHDRRVGAVTAG